MFDTMTLVKFFGGLCGAFLIFLLGGFAAETIYHSAEADHHGDEHVQGFLIEVPDTSVVEEVEPVEEIDFEVLMASADAGAGEGEWRNCRNCHALEEGNQMVGPSLYGIVGRDVAAIDGFGYSGALIAQAEVWTEENLYNFLVDPQGWAPGTAMGYPGLKDPQDRANLIAFLDATDG